MARDRLSRVIFAGLVATVALAPLPFASNRPWSWSVLSLTVGGLLVLWALAAWRDPRALGVAWRHSRFYVVGFAALVAWILFQASPFAPEAWHHPLWREAAGALAAPPAGAISLDPQATLTALMRLLAYAGVFWLAFQLGREPNSARVAVWSVALAGLAYSVYGLVVEFGRLDSILWYERWAYRESLTSTFINRNSFATYAGIALTATLGLLVDLLRHAPPLLSRAGARFLIGGLAGRLGLLAVMALAIGSALLLTDSRGGLVSALVGLLVLAGGFSLHRGARPGPAVATLAGVLLFAVAILALSGETTLARLGKTLIEAEERPAVYALVWRGITDNPWLGAGYGTFEAAFPLIRDTTIRGDLIYDKAHNSYLEFAFEAGVPAFALMLALLAGLARRCVAGVWSRRRDRLAPCVGLAATALVATHALVDFSLQIPAVAVTYALVLGVGCAQSWSSREPDS
ncbi:MAG: O-antigen ligase family protein [Alphaproteobacteria bacterium]